MSLSCGEGALDARSPRRCPRWPAPLNRTADLIQRGQVATGTEPIAGVSVGTFARAQGASSSPFARLRVEPRPEDFCVVFAVQGWCGLCITYELSLSCANLISWSCRTDTIPFCVYGLSAWPILGPELISDQV